jgi:glycosyltransferase involved in cell wall biosynthesis
MRPYLLIAGDFVKTGGMDRANHALACHLADRGFETHLVAHRIDKDLAGRLNVVFHRVPKPLDSYFLGEPLLNRVGSAWASKIARCGGRVVVNGGNCPWPDVNWVHYLHATHKPQIDAGPLWRIKAEFSYRRNAASERRALDSALLVVTNSDRTREEVLQEHHLPEDRVRTVYYGVDPAIFRPTSRHEFLSLRASLGWQWQTPVILFIGGLSDRRKGFDTLFAAWERLCAWRDWDANLAVVGTGGELPSWRAKAAAVGLESRIQFMGFRTDVPQVMAACDALVSPTRYEAYGLAVHEAVCCALPVLVSGAAGITERLAGPLRELILSEPDDVDGLIDRLRLWRSRRDEFAIAAAVLSEKIRHRSWDDMASEFFSLVAGVDICCEVNRRSSAV